MNRLKSAINLGARVNNRADLVKLGIPETEADLIAGNSSLTTAPPPQPIAVEFTILPTDLVGYLLGVRREVTGSTDPDETLIPISPTGKVAYEYDDAVTGALFTLFVKSPGGEPMTS